MNPALQFFATSAAVSAQTPVLGSERLLGMAGALLLVVSLVVVLAWLAQRIGAVRNGLGRSLRIREVLAVGARERILLVDCEGQRLLIGSSPAGLVRLHAFAGIPDEGEEISTGADVTPTGMRGVFGDLLDRQQVPSVAEATSAPQTGIRQA
jgi:flagellar protein FliO/FliZ